MTKSVNVKPSHVCARHFWEKVIGQDQVLRALNYSLENKTLSHAYLFVGPEGLGKINAARAIAAQLMCENGGCGNCHICTRLENNSHPDFKLIEPEGKTGYLKEQIRELIFLTQLAPMEASRKVFVIRQADMFNIESANAFLKTLEEPSESTIFILLSTSQDAVLPTVKSRCQIYRFKPLSPTKAREVLMEKTGVSIERADTALAANGNIVAAARDYLQSPKQQAVHKSVATVFSQLALADDLDVLNMVRHILRSTLDSVEDQRSLLEADLLERKEFLDSAALKQLERYNKRRLSALETRQTKMVFNVFSSHLAEYLRSQNLTMTQVEKVSWGQERITLARQRLKSNVNVELICEALLFDLREVLRCQ
jgi:DNA polymerase-3 subunit delta'